MRKYAVVVSIPDDARDDYPVRDAMVKCVLFRHLQDKGLTAASTPVIEFFERGSGLAGGAVVEVV